MTPIPVAELNTLMLAVAVAYDLAAEGNAAEGYAVLLAGLRHADEAQDEGMEWGAALADRWRAACERFAERHGIRPA